MTTDMETNKEYKGVARLGVKDDSFAVTLSDVEGTDVMTICLGGDEMMRLLTGSIVACSFVPFFGAKKVGKKREKATQEVFIPFGPFEEYEQYVESALKSFEVEGWIAHREDLKDPRCFVRYQGPKMEPGAWYNVRFERYVDPETVDEQSAD